MSEKSQYNQYKALKRNVVDDVVYSTRQKVVAWIGLIIGLWGVFFTCVAILFCMTQGIWGEHYEVSFTDHTILTTNK